jgi:hypothetical protein
MENGRMSARPIWHVTVNGEPACTSPLVAQDDRVDPPMCAARSRERAEAYARLLRGRLPGATVTVVEHGCPMRGE